MFRTSLMGVMALSIAFCARANSKPYRILHISLHAGCIKDVEEMGRALGLEITSWLIQDDPKKFDGLMGIGNDIYNITSERAKRVWELNQGYFEQFDVVITSDTAPLSRIFLQNGWSKPLVIWICNRFDYADGETAGGRFPDAEYYALFQKAWLMPNVRIISYTRYEHVYARRKGVEVGDVTINPVGRLPRLFSPSESGIPPHIDKTSSLFLFPRLEKADVDFVLAAGERLAISMYHGAYNGPEDLKDFKGVLYFPYAWSNLALFENLQQGIVHFVPSEKFIQDVNNQMRVLTTTEFDLCDWWAPEFREFFVYFDSFEDLKQKIETTNYGTLREHIARGGLAHREEMLRRWRKVFEELFQ